MSNMAAAFRESSHHPRCLADTIERCAGVKRLPAKNGIPREVGKRLTRIKEASKAPRRTLRP
jgi:hypothetical protein